MRLFFATILLLLKVGITVPSTHAEIVLINGLKLGSRMDTKTGLRVPNTGGNAFIILKQYDNNCGPTSAEMVLHYYGMRPGLGNVWVEGGIHNVEFGTFPQELEDALDGLGIPSLHLPRDGGHAYAFGLMDSIDESRPPIVLLRLALKSYHYVVAVGYKTAANGDLTHVLVANPNGDFQWWNDEHFMDAWSLRNANLVGGKHYGAGGAFVSTIISTQADPYTMIVPKAPPTQQYPPLWAQTIGFEVKGKLDFRPTNWRDWTETLTFNHPFESYFISAVEPLQWNVFEGDWNLLRFGNSSVDSANVVGAKSLRIKGTIVDGWFDRGTLWVIARAYSETPPLIPDRFTVNGVWDGGNFTSGVQRTLTVKVYSQNNVAVGGVLVRFIDSDDKEISFSRTSTKTNGSGAATTTLYTGSEGAADFEVVVEGLPSRTIRFNVVPQTRAFTRTRTVEGTWQLFCFSKRNWTDWTRYVDVPSRTLRHSVSLTHSASRNANLKGWEWHDSDTIKVWGRIKQKGCWGHYEWVDYTIRGEYKFTAGQRPIQGAPAFTSEQDTLSEYWQDVSQVPIETDVFTNYPNPFNPETWIPYQLATPAEVTVDIYSMEGHLVRTLSLGHQPAGGYQSKSRAAYWDGRNAQGEPVASGVYFYTLTAGDFSATRKMLIRK